MTQLRRSNWSTRGSLLNEFHHDDQFYNSLWLSGMRLPALNVKDLGATYEIELVAPQFDKRDMRILIDQGFLTVSGETYHENKKDENGGRAYTSFSRSFNLPANTSDEDVEAKYEGGILKLTITKKVQPESNRRTIEIK